MSQANILELLEKEKKPLSRFEISLKLGENGTKISHCLKKLLYFNEIKCIEIDRNQAKAFYGKNAPSHRMKLYYISFTATGFTIIIPIIFHTLLIL